MTPTLLEGHDQSLVVILQDSLSKGPRLGVPQVFIV